MEILWKRTVSAALGEKCPNTELFLVRIFVYSVWIQENTDEKKLRMWTLLTQWKFQAIRPKFCINCVFPQNFHNKKLCEISEFYKVVAVSVLVIGLEWNLPFIVCHFISMLFSVLHQVLHEVLKSMNIKESIGAKWVKKMKILKH